MAQPYIYIKITPTNQNIVDFNQLIVSDPDTCINLLTDLLDSVNCRSTPSTLEVSTSTTDTSIPSTGGTSATITKT